MIRKNKKAQALANFLLVFLTLMIVASSLFYISIKENSYAKEFNSPYVLDSVYLREELVNFYLQDIVEHAALEVKDKQELMNNINLLAGKYENTDENAAIILKSIENLKEEDITLIGDKGEIETIKVSFNVEIYSSNSGLNSVKYVYAKDFEADTKEEVILEE
ncbi:hypothetical protein J4477_04190 [Candidatus Pacearchaeota archaeon]|nr:hypothetical protein [Candidatus Pacearchaeota archaeon]